nr:hypothetical protein [Tanacetum cinerariifolium]
KFKYEDVKPTSTLMDKEIALLKDSDGADVDVYLYSSSHMAEFDIGQEDDQFWCTAAARTLDNGEIELNATLDDQVKTIIKVSVRRHLKLADADGISTLPTTKIFKQLALMVYVIDSDKLTFQKDEAITKEMHDRLGRATTTASSLAAEQGSGNISKTQTKATPSGPCSLRTSSEGDPRCHFTMRDS